MINSKFLKMSAVTSVVVFMAACTSNPESVTRADDEAFRTITYIYDDSNTGRQAASSEDIMSGAKADDAQVVIVTTSELDSVVYFDFDQSVLKLATRELLADHAKALLGSTEVVRLEGHADELGTREYNMALGERRAKAVMNYLSSLGVPRSRMVPVSYGEEKPVVLGSGEAARAKNRRVEIIYN